MKYLKQDWSNYDDDLTIQDNIANGGVATVERLEHMEEGIAAANNTQMDITVIPGSEDLCIVSEEKGIKRIEVRTSSLEPKQLPIEVMIYPGDVDNTVIEEIDGKKRLNVFSSSVESKWPAMDIQIVAGKDNKTKVEDIDGKRKITIYTTALNSFTTAAVEKDIIVDIDDWVGDVAPFESIIAIDGITSSNILRFTKGSQITDDQLKAVKDCGVSVVEDLDGTIRVVASKSKPIIDIPIHVTII